MTLSIDERLARLQARREHQQRAAERATENVTLRAHRQERARVRAKATADKLRSQTARWHKRYFMAHNRWHPEVFKVLNPTRQMESELRYRGRRAVLGHTVNGKWVTLEPWPKPV